MDDTSGFKATSLSVPDLTSSLCMELSNLDVTQEGARKNIPEIRTEWIGTSQLYIDENVGLQIDGHLNGLISYREVLASNLRVHPYDPALYIEICRLDSKLSFTDVAAANAHKAIILIQAALMVIKAEPLTALARKVRDCISHRIGTFSADGVNNELQDLHSQAYVELLYGLIGCACSWEGLLVAKEALKRFPLDLEILECRESLKKIFEQKLAGQKEQISANAISFSRSGRIYQKMYPWLDKTLYVRTPDLVREVNKAMLTEICVVRPVVFGVTSEDTFYGKSATGDVGPLGLFATRDIKEGEIIMVDKSVTGVSDVPSSKLRHCDACHASLSIPYLNPSEIIHPECCSKVAFCSQECHDTAIKGYHQVLCGKDFDWLYESQKQGELDGSGAGWAAIIFLRVIAVILADSKVQEHKGDKANGKQNVTLHPLKQPLIARMAANYTSPLKLHPVFSHNWNYVSNVVAPTRILMELGIDIFADTNFAPEVVQTIYWRIENNANQSATDLSLYTSQLHQRKAPDGDLLCMTSINSNYLFFNHSCNPNVSWHGAVPDPWVGISWLEGMNGEILQPGCSAVKCTASRDIAGGEELKISYVGDPQGKDGEMGGGRQVRCLWLTKWFEGGCGCELCQKENKAGLLTSRS